LTVARCIGLRCSLTKNALPVGFMRARFFNQAAIARSSSPRSGCVVDKPPSQAGDVQDAAFGVHLLELQAASLRHAEAVAEHQQQSRASLRLPLGGGDQLVHLKAGEVLALVVKNGRFSGFAPLHHFVESSQRKRPPKPL
jgi:hypothetical protein